MRTRFAAVCLALEAFLVFFATLVASSLSDLPRGTVWVAGGLLSLACVVAAGLVRRPGGLVVGWVVQALVLATGFWVPGMFVMGALFVAMWVWLLRIGTRIDRDRAAWAAREGEPGSGAAGGSRGGTATGPGTSPGATGVGG